MAKNKGGAPTKYKEEYCKDMIEFFDIDHTREVEKTRINKDGTLTKWFETVPNSLPTFERFAVNCDVHVDTLHEWKNASNKDGDLINPKFSEAYKKCKNMQKEMINNLGMLGLYNSAYTMFVAKNITDMRDTQHIEQESNVRNTVVITDQELAEEAKKMKEGLQDG